MGRVEISRPGVQAVIGAHKLRQERCNKKGTWRHAGSRTFTNSTTTPRRIMRVVLDHYKVTKREEHMSNMQTLMALEVVSIIGKDGEESLENKFLTK